MRKMMLVLLCLLPATAMAESLNVSDGWARASIPGTENGAAYATLENPNSDAVKITSISSDISDVAEVHRHVVSGDVMKMEAVSPLVIAPGEIIKFQPGGHHFMLFDLNSPLKADESFSLILHFDSGKQQKIQFTVQ
ncbi:copper chaperone PCu(A)C [Idiomarina sp. HP20-50]|uniref:copper chaperone PCu(A)C n=1 Tax=Idiomarina sp. HP20-50 TaxID=3070813 RepID=UPI00294B7753|nr:copper chaperone PCu(A)C [Idiomarina sp. HP20-50]MDV6315543.1 copper chaperone PCu(A)C [Idiomarina sp. HP20-50]